MTPVPGDISISMSRPDFRSLIITCVDTRGGSIELYGESLPDSPDYDWSIYLGELRNRVYWPSGVRISPEDRRALVAVIKDLVDGEGLRVRWEDPVSD